MIAKPSILKKPVCLISGGTRGIGLAVSLRLARLGYHVVTFARSCEAVDIFSGKMEEVGGTGQACVGDARDEKFLLRFVEDILSQHGRIDVLIHNAGGGKRGEVLSAQIEDWDWILDVNLRAPMLLTKFVLPALLQSPHGAVFFISSMAAQVGIAGSSAYGASKAGLLRFAHSLFEEIREKGVKVCAICPGYVDTALIPNRKSLMREEMISPEDIAKTIEWILNLSASACPVEILIRPQKNPFRN